MLYQHTIMYRGDAQHTVPNNKIDNFQALMTVAKILPSILYSTWFQQTLISFLFVLLVVHSTVLQLTWHAFSFWIQPILLYFALFTHFIMQDWRLARDAGCKKLYFPCVIIYCYNYKDPILPLFVFYFIRICLKHAWIIINSISVSIFLYCFLVTWC